MEVQSYIPVLLQALVALGFVGLVLTLTHILGPNRKAKNKDISFECGIESQGNARIPVSVKYFMTAILFVLFKPNLTVPIPKTLAKASARRRFHSHLIL